ncbi:uncharacterized protein FIBRA_07092 [Fibroporia radiculosa]|uniref:Major facilitator superfamily (MFS) profile domain-containing protein n=1 Tax=Fibroporia radiculosa TaxID=599839 RepID=J4IBM0_9APHY|nr:uncharacterized protein FIBRA_07092 [Fibroporia radiculosa]CCM04896.1 predicted protein [Fibroporia radiculosa]
MSSEDEKTVTLKNQLQDERDEGYEYGIWGSWIPTYIPNNSLVVIWLLVASSCITSTTLGYDGSMMNGLNILPSYASYFDLDDVTTGLLTASIWIGGCLAGLVYGRVTDVLGRRPAMFYAALITVIAVVLQGAAQNMGMFVFARILVGFGTTASGVTGPSYLAETLPVEWRAWGVGLLNDFYYVGGLIAAGITYGTFALTTTWAWRIPSILQGTFSILTIFLIPFIPESPRWLASRSLYSATQRSLAQTYANGDVESEEVKTAFEDIVKGLEWEKEEGRQMTLKEVFRTRGSRKRVLLACSAAVFSTIAGNVIASYYLGSMLDNAGITNAKTQLEINIILNAFCLVCALFGTYSCDKWGRKPTTVVSAGLLTIFIFMIGGLTKTYGSSTNTSAIYATVAIIFLFQGAYSFGWTPVLYLYPPEVLNYTIRANGMGVFQFVANGVALLFVFTMPIAITKLSWKIYIINGAWDVLAFFAVIIWWVETKGKKLEEIDELIEGRRMGGVGVESGAGLEKVSGIDFQRDGDEDGKCTVTAAGKGQLKQLPLAKLKKYANAYDIKVNGVLEKDELIETILAARDPRNGCLRPANEEYYRRNSVPSRRNNRSRGFFTRAMDAMGPDRSTNQSAQSSPHTTYQARQRTTSGPSTFPRPDLDPQRSQPRQQRPNPPPPPPPPPSNPSPHPSSYGFAYRPPPTSSPHLHAPGGSQPRGRTRAASASPAPRVPTPPPAPSLDELLEMSEEQLSHLSIHALKTVLFQNHVNVRLVVEKEELVGKVRTLLEEERGDRERHAAELEEERLADERMRRDLEEAMRRSREQSAAPTVVNTEESAASGALPNESEETENGPEDALDWDRRGDIAEESLPPPPPPKSTTSPPPPALPPKAQAMASRLERTGLCVICQDEEANIAIVDCG